MIVHEMADQALLTLQSLSTTYQAGSSGVAYEIIVVENESGDMLAADEVAGYGPSVRYVRRVEESASPAAACNEGIGLARGRHVALMVDGARMVTPGLIATCVAAAAAFPDSVVAVPGYHLGHQLQRDPATTGYDEAAERRLLAQIDWPAAGYRLFDIAVLSGSCSNGFLVPLAETNFLLLSQEAWTELGGVDERFTTLGGGFVNLDLYRRACDHTGRAPVILPGEGTFHQYHGGATTGRRGLDRDRLMAEMVDEYRRIRGRPFEPPPALPVLFGSVPAPAARFLEHSARQARELSSAS